MLNQFLGDFIPIIQIGVASNKVRRKLDKTHFFARAALTKCIKACPHKTPHKWQVNVITLIINIFDMRHLFIFERRKIAVIQRDGLRALDKLSNDIELVMLLR